MGEGHDSSDNWEEAWHSDQPYKHQSRPRVTSQTPIRHDRYEAAKSAKVGSMILCPGCGKLFLKRSYQHVFCSNKGRGNCKDRYWNRATAERADRAREWQ